MEEQIKAELSALFERHFGQPPTHIDGFPKTASARRYYRLSGGGKTAIGAYGPDVAENRAFIYFSRHFKQKGLSVPEIYAGGGHYYLQQDLGDETLMRRNQQTDRQGGFPESLLALYKKTLDQLLRLQLRGGQGLDYHKGCVRPHFDATAMHWDLNYFKYYFLNLSALPYSEEALQKDFDSLVDYLCQADSHYFMARDFQSRNVMLLEDEPYFIDYQSGRRGPLQYDLVSLLFQSKAKLPANIRTELLEHYLQKAQDTIPLDRRAFKSFFHGFTLLRMLQVLGAYGRRGRIERLPYFIQSIPLALENIACWLEQPAAGMPAIPYLRSLLRQLLEQSKESAERSGGLQVSVASFSYKEGIPDDSSGHGGGFVFDCRHIHNPGRYAPYKKLTGRDASVQAFLMEKSSMPDFLRETQSVVGRAVENYLQRGFDHLMVSFGCTGGQHRSVFAADRMADFIKREYPNAKVVLRHIVQERKAWKN